MNQIGLEPMRSYVNIRVSEEEKQRVAQYAHRHGLTISEAIRDILERHVKDKAGETHD